MEEYRSILKRRMQLTGALCGLFPTISMAIRFLAENASSPLNSHEVSFMHGVATGTTLAMVFITVFSIVKISRALKDDGELKKMYIAEHDERAIFIRNKIGGNGLKIVIILLMFFAIIACYFDMVVTFSLIGAAMLCTVTMVTLKLYYNQKY